MSHKNRNRFKAPIRRREAQPLVKQTKKGVIMYCPFCKPPHPIVPGVDMPCGSRLEVKVVQMTISASVARANKIVCIKCGGTGVGELAPFHDGYVHILDCKPNVRIATVMPRRSLVARLVSKMPQALRRGIEKRTGRAQAIHVIDKEGKETGQIAGYFFDRPKASA